MKKIVLSLSSNFEDMKKNVVKYIDLKSDWENIVVVPDRFSLLMELAIFKQKNVSSVFNTNVMPISALAKNLLEKVGVFYDSVSTTDQMFLIRRAMQKTKEYFVCLPKNVSPPLLQEISKTISQLKASKVKPEDLQVDSISKNLQDKFADLKLVYKEYETYLENKMDSAKLLELFEENLEKMESLKTINLFFVGFDSFTNQIFEVIKKLSKVVSLIVVGGVFHFSKANKKAFELDVYEKFSALGKEYNVEIVYEKNSMFPKAQFAFENVFAYKQGKMINENYVSLLSFNSFDMEIDFVAKEIANKIKNEDLRYGDFNLASPALEADKILLEQALIKYDINYFIDTQEKLSATALSEFVFQFLNVCLNGFEKNSLLSFASSYFVNPSNEQRGLTSYIIEKYFSYSNNLQNIKKLMIEEDIIIFNQVKPFFDLLEEFLTKVENIKTIEGFTNLLKSLFEKLNVQEKCEQRSLELGQYNMLKQEKIYLQLYEKVTQAIESVNTFLSQEVVELKEYIDLLKVVFESRTIATVPVNADCVFVGDVSQSYFDERKHFYLVGATASRLPQTLFDGGFINDDNLKQVEKTLNITPSVKTINKRNKFKLLNLFAYSTDSFTASYSFASSDGKEEVASILIEDLKNIFFESENKNIEINNVSNVLYKLTPKQEKKFVLSYALNEKVLKQFLFNAIKNQEISKKSTNSIFEVLDYKNLITEKELQLLKGEKEYPKIKNAKELFFANSRTKVSQLETYFSSPFLHFVSYGLKLQEIETSDINKLDIGNLLHYVSEKFLSVIEKPELDIRQEINNIFNKIGKEKQFYKFYLNSENKSSLNYLKNEAENLCRVILQQKEKSLFKPTHFEKAFKELNYFEEVNLGLSGRVDRIDEREKDFVVFDYKTGKVELNPKVVYLGKKIQLLIYADIHQKQTGKKCSGIFYFPIKNSFEKEQDKKLKGFFDKEKTLALDKTLSLDNPSSVIINAEIKTNKQNKENNIIEFKANTGTEYLQDMIEYAKNVCENALKEMIDGNVAQVEKQAEFLDGVFEDELFLKLKNPESMKIKDYIFEELRKPNED